jgi:hypothetical protein
MCPLLLLSLLQACGSAFAGHAVTDWARLRLSCKLGKLGKLGILGKLGKLGKSRVRKQPEWQMQFTEGGG